MTKCSDCGHEKREHNRIIEDVTQDACYLPWCRCLGYTRKRYEQGRGAKRNGNKECLVACNVPPMLNVIPPASPPLPRVYYCKKCDRYTDIMWSLDKGNRPKSKCYKCGEENLEAVR